MEQDKAFYCRDGKVANSLDELANILSDMPQDEFSHHVNEYKNDFANWIEHIIKDGDLAQAVRKSGTKQEILLVINERIMRKEISRGLRQYTERREPVPLPEPPVQEEVRRASLQQITPPEVTVVEIPPEAEEKPQVPVQQVRHEFMQQTKQEVMQQTKQEKPTHFSREADYKEHPYKYFTLREFVLGVLLGFVLGFVVSKLIFSLMTG